MTKKLRIAISFLLLSPCLNAQIELSEVHYEHSGGFGDPYELFYSIGVSQDTSLPDTLVFDGNVKVGKYDSLSLCHNRKLLKFQGKVVFPGYGNYAIVFRDSNSFHKGVNVGDSVFIKNELNIAHSNFFDNLRSVRFQSKPYYLTNKNEAVRVSPSVKNHEGDSLHFELLPIGDSANYWVPDSVTFNPKSGELIWNAPDSLGTYEFKIEAEEHDLDGGFKNSVENDLTVKVLDSNLSNGAFTEISGFKRNSNGFIERKVSPGEDLDLVFSFEDELGDSVSIEALGEPFLRTPSPFFFTSYADSTTINASLSWTPDSFHVRPHPYILTFIGKSYPSCTWHYKTVMIYVENPTTSVEEESRKDGEAFTIHPNPVKGDLLLSSSIDLPQHQAHIMDAKGRKVKAVQLPEGKNRITVQGLEKGIYFLIVQGEKGRWQERFVKK